jgi:probable phosphoglycerate mutase
MATVLFARHAESTWNRQGRLQGWAPSLLTDHGRTEADALADWLARRTTDRLVTSDLERAVATADRVAAETGVDAVLNRAWRERDYGVLQGLPPEEAFERFERLSLARGEAALAERLDGGESIREFATRVEAAWDSLCASLDGETVVVVAHGGVLRVVSALFTERSLLEVFRDTSPGNCAVTEVSVRDAGTTVVRDAATDHLSLD